MKAYSDLLQAYRREPLKAVNYQEKGTLISAFALPIACVCVRVCVRARARVRACVCVCARARVFV